MGGIGIVLLYAVWGMYRGMVGRKTIGEFLVLLVVILAIVVIGEITITSMLPGIFTFLLLFLWVAIRRARERSNK